MATPDKSITGRMTHNQPARFQELPPRTELGKRLKREREKAKPPMEMTADYFPVENALKEDDATKTKQ